MEILGQVYDAVKNETKVFGEIDRSLKPIETEIFLCKPNMKAISNLSEAYNRKLNLRLSDLNEINFNIPYLVDVRHQLVENPNIEKIRERYLLKVKRGGSEEFFIINQIKEADDDNGSSKYIHAFSLGYELRDKSLYDIIWESKNVKQLLTDALAETIWDIHPDLLDVDNYFNTEYRSFEVSTQTVLDFIIEVAEKFNAVIVWDTRNRLINFKKPEEVGRDKGLRLTDDNYLMSTEKESNADEMVTRLTPIGADGLRINRVTPTGASYIEDYSYFLYPFQRDENRNVIQKSKYMSDGLAHAILDYQEFLKAKEDVFKNLNTSQSELLEEQDILELEKSTVEADYLVSQQLTDMQRADNTYSYLTFDLTSGAVTKSLTLDLAKNYFLMIKSSNDNSLSVTVNGTTKSITAGEWSELARINNKESESISISGTSGTTVEVISVRVSPDEFEPTNEVVSVDSDGKVVVKTVEGYNNTSDLIKLYCVDYNKSKLDAIEDELQEKDEALAMLDIDIEALRADMAVENHFTPELLIEWNPFIINKDWVEESHINDEKLYEDGKKQFEKLREPQMQVNISVANFLKSVECQRDWNKLTLGDIIHIYNSRLKMYVEAKLIEVDYDLDGDDISLTIANVKDVQNDEEQFIKTLYGAISTSTTVQMNKFKWDKIQETAFLLNDLVGEAWDATKRKIIAGTNETVEISNRGILIKDYQDPDKFLIAQHAVIAITDDGGRTYKNAITTDGVIGDRIIGRILAGQNLVIENTAGSFRVDGGGVTIKGTALNITADDGSNLIDKWNAMEQSASDYVDTQIEELNGVISTLEDKVDNLTADGQITQLEASILENMLFQLTSESSQVISASVSLGVTTEKMNYETALNTLTDYLNTNFVGKPSYPIPVTDAQRTSIENYFKDVQAKKSILIDKISSARLTVSTGYTDEQIADVNQSISDFQNLYNEAFSDLKLTNIEASLLENSLLQVQKESVDLINVATALGITTEKTNYSNALTALNTELANNWINKTSYPLSITVAQRDAINAKFNDVQTTKSVLVNKITSVRYGQANAYTDGEISEVNTAIGALDKEISDAFSDTQLTSIEANTLKNSLEQVKKESIDLVNIATGLSIATEKTNYSTSLSTLESEMSKWIGKPTYPLAITTTDRTNILNKFSDLQDKKSVLINKIVAIRESNTMGYIDGEVLELNTALGNLGDQIDSFSSDLKLTLAEANSLNTSLQQLKQESTDIINVATSFNITTAKTDYSTALTNLETELNTNWINKTGYPLNITSAQRTSINTKFGDVQSKKSVLVNAISLARQNKAVSDANANTSTESQAGKDAWAKFSGAGNTIPAGNVEFNFASSSTKGGSATNTVNVGTQTATSVQNATINFNSRNDRKSTVPANPVVVGDGTAVDHAINTDGSADISFEWTFNGTGDAYDIDGFIVYAFQSTSSSAYSFGTSTSSEQVYYVTPDRRAVILYGLPANKYYTFGIQAYRIVDADINATGMLKSAIVKSAVAGENPYLPSASVAFAGNVTGTVDGTSVATIKNNALNALQLGTAYNNVTIDSNAGLVVTRSDNVSRAIMNATDGIKIQANVGGVWKDKLFVDSSGVLKAKGLIITADDDAVVIDGSGKAIDFSKFTTINGKLSDANINSASIWNAKETPEGATAKAQQYAYEGQIYAKGTGLNRSANRIVKVNNQEKVNNATRGLHLVVLNRSDLSVAFDQSYDVYGGTVQQDALAIKLNELTDSVIVIITSFDAIATNENLQNAMIRCGGTGKAFGGAFHRVPYALIGIPNIGKGAGLEMYTGIEATAPFAEITTKVINGTPQGIDTSRISLDISLRNDLRLQNPLPTSIIMDANGITASASNGGYARLDSRGLYIYGGALQIDGGLLSSQIDPSATATWDKAGTSVQQGTTYNGIKIDSLSGLVVTSATHDTMLNATHGLRIFKKDGTTVFSLDSTTGNVVVTGNINMTGGSIPWGTVTPPTPAQVGALPTGTTASDIGGEAYITRSSTAPAHSAGKLWLDTSVTPNMLYRSTGTAWVKTAPTTATEVGARPSSWLPTASEVGAVVNSQTAVFNTLTNNGALKGLYMSAGELYISADYIKAGTITGDRIVGGTISGVTVSVDTDLTVGNKIKVGQSWQDAGTKELTFKSGTSFIRSVGDDMKVYAFNSIEFDSDVIKMGGGSGTVIDFSVAQSINWGTHAPNTTAKFG